MPVFTLLHVLISLAGIGAGFVVVFGLLTSQRLERWTLVFLGTTLATSVTGFLFPFHGFTPAIGVGILSVIVLGVATVARYFFRLRGFWGRVYVVGATTALYFNVFVLIVQGFQKVGALKALAPTQSEPPFLGAQGAALLAFIVLGLLAVRRFQPTLKA